MRNTVDRFNGRQQDYQAARPSYAQELLDWLGELYVPPERYTAADIGSGTGKLSAQLLAAGFRVCGVEPNPDMRGAAEALLGGDPRFSSVNGADRDTGLPDQSVDLVTAAQAFAGRKQDAAHRLAADLTGDLHGAAAVRLFHDQLLVELRQRHGILDNGRDGRGFG